MSVRPPTPTPITARPHSSKPVHSRYTGRPHLLQPAHVHQSPPTLTTARPRSLQSAHAQYSSPTLTIYSPPTPITPRPHSPCLKDQRKSANRQNFVIYGCPLNYKANEMPSKVQGQRIWDMIKEEGRERSMERRDPTLRLNTTN